MKATLFTLLILPLFSFSQNGTHSASSKPSGTDCPTWNDKNKPKSKAEYYKSLRSTKAKNGQTSVNRTPKHEPATPKKEKNIDSPTDESTPKNNPILKQGQKNNSVQSTNISDKKSDEKEKKNTKKKTKQLPTRNTTKSHKSKANDCPNF